MIIVSGDMKNIRNNGKVSVKMNGGHFGAPVVEFKTVCCDAKRLHETTMGTHSIWPMNILCMRVCRVSLKSFRSSHSHTHTHAISFWFIQFVNCELNGFCLFLFAFFNVPEWNADKYLVRRDVILHPNEHSPRCKRDVYELCRYFNGIYITFANSL